MTFKDFLFFGHVSEVIKVGNKILPNNNLELIIEQEKDSPALYRYLHTALEFEIYCIQEVIIGVSFKSDDNPINHTFFLDKNGKTELKSKTDLQKFINYIEAVGCIWLIDKMDTGGKLLAIKINENAKVMYDFNTHHFGFYQIIYFDNKLYESMKPHN
ncbi:hypothetical protein Fleli_0605 [Bernardetia litoralis DSM 6794]|uniref:Uncharacterized protein n=1 Tax=Bernardetia litoralis (strain ATCC 23117 / DSM 6794 / NBRC 15988 / NCIMB 1366 / Fx l1 / Sio-4) TaxID=880071 RepID=I4AGI4_BERLS|nr:hypothetical protein [Bernardetia litoralis]AFM03069.1 hypothetical protein Fleli_0605 [Bernardetia litoralis DSM 6794]